MPKGQFDCKVPGCGGGLDVENEHALGKLFHQTRSTCSVPVIPALACDTCGRVHFLNSGVPVFTKCGQATYLSPDGEEILFVEVHTTLVEGGDYVPDPVSFPIYRSVQNISGGKRRWAWLTPEMILTFLEQQGRYFLFQTGEIVWRLRRADINHLQEFPTQEVLSV